MIEFSWIGLSRIGLEDMMIMRCSAIEVILYPPSNFPRHLLVGYFPNYLPLLSLSFSPSLPLSFFSFHLHTLTTLPYSAEKIKEDYTYVCQDIVKEFNKYDADPYKYFARFKGEDSVTGRVSVVF